jgi:hypothetical protein
VALLVMALLAAGARLRAKRARRLAGPAE